MIQNTENGATLKKILLSDIEKKESKRTKNFSETTRVD